MPEISVDIQIWCGTCGDGLCNQTSESPRGGGFDVNVCETCKDNALDEGHNKGYDKGFKEGREEGYEEGKEKGFDKGWDKFKEEHR